MSVSIVVADNNKERQDTTGLRIFDSANVVTWSKKLKMWLMQKKHNHLGLEDRPACPTNNASAAAKAKYKLGPKTGEDMRIIIIIIEYRTALDTRLKRKDTCVSAIYVAVEGIPDAL